MFCGQALGFIECETDDINEVLLAKAICTCKGI